MEAGFGLRTGECIEKITGLGLENINLE